MLTIQNSPASRRVENPPPDRADLKFVRLRTGDVSGVFKAYGDCRSWPPIGAKTAKEDGMEEPEAPTAIHLLNFLHHPPRALHYLGPNATWCTRDSKAVGLVLEPAEPGHDAA
jgi:hypothetical protein